MIKKIFAGFFFITILAQVVLANSLVSQGRKMEELLVKRTQLRSELLELENQIAQVSSLSIIKAEAEKLGLSLGQLQILPPPPVALVPE